MNLHEYQGKEILNSFGVRIQRGIVANTPNEAVEADEAIDDKVYQVSLGYLVNNNLHLHIGYKKADQANEIKHTVGAMIAYYFDM